MLSNEVELQIVKIEEDRVQIGITAPPDVPIHRAEVVRKIAARKAQRAADARRKENSGPDPSGAEF
jgi:carbon storage regulator CsrA